MLDWLVQVLGGDVRAPRVFRRRSRCGASTELFPRQVPLLQQISSLLSLLVPTRGLVTKLWPFLWAKVVRFRMVITIRGPQELLNLLSEPSFVSVYIASSVRRMG